jgi:hypothetical protein
VCNQDRTAVMFLAFPVILLILKNQVWNGCFPALPVQIYQSWLLFFYTSLALRENILRVNGSDIRPWLVSHLLVSVAELLPYRLVHLLLMCTCDVHGRQVWLFELAFVNGLTGGCTIIIVQCLWHL